MNAFHLMRMVDVWKIVNAASALDLEGCKPESRERKHAIRRKFV